MPPNKEHVHKFKRHTYETGSKIFFCTLPKCNKKTKVALALGKECICWRCGEPFILSEYSIRLVKPHCDDCHKSKDGVPAAIISPVAPFDKSEQHVIEGGSSLSERLKRVTQREDEEI